MNQDPPPSPTTAGDRPADSGSAVNGLAYHANTEIEQIGSKSVVHKQDRAITLPKRAVRLVLQADDTCENRETIESLRKTILALPLKSSHAVLMLEQVHIVIVNKPNMNSPEAKSE